MKKKTYISLETDLSLDSLAEKLADSLSTDELAEFMEKLGENGDWSLEIAYLKRMLVMVKNDFPESAETLEKFINEFE